MPQVIVLNKIDLVDDEQKIIEVLKEYAEFEGYDVTEAEIISCELEYQIDTKGFYQPVYRFDIASDSPDLDSIPIYVSAI